jgi:CelD/BcsL family acetyltransferase involved in cellulose biosynthesis
MWEVLWSKSGASVFQSHHWIIATQNHLLGNFRLHIGIVWDEAGVLAAAVPCRVKSVRGTRILEWAAQETSDYCDGIGDLISLEACWTALLTSGGFDIIHLENLRPDAAIIAFLRCDRMEIRESDGCYTLISTWPTSDAWMQAQYPKKRNAYSRGLRKLEDTGRVDVQFHTKPPEGVVSKLRSLKLEWAVAAGRAAPLVEDDHLLIALVDALAAAGCLLLVVIKCNDDIVAGSINAVQGARMLSWFTVYDLKYDRASPGIVLLTECIRWAWDNGLTEHDHVRGAHSYKLPFSNASIVLRRYTAPRSLRGYAALAMRDIGRAMPRLKIGRPSL